MRDKLWRVGKKESVAFALFATTLTGALVLFGLAGNGSGSVAQEPTGVTEPGDIGGAQPGDTPGRVSDSGRLNFYGISDFARVDDDADLPELGAIYWRCEADALALVRDGRVVEIHEVGPAAEISIGEAVHSDRADQGVWKVHRDENGDLQWGCDPDSWVDLNGEHDLTPD